MNVIEQTVKRETLDAVIAFLAERRNVRPARITAATRLREDLGVDGFDAYELLTAFEIEFKVDFTGFELARYFGPEASWNPLYALYCFCTGRGKKKPITVHQLAVAAGTGVWRT